MNYLRDCLYDYVLPRKTEDAPCLFNMLFNETFIIIILFNDRRIGIDWERFLTFTT